MDLREYQRRAKKTLLVSKNDNAEIQALLHKLDLSHMAMGMCSELSELTDAYATKDMVNISEELADIMWYVAGYCTLRKLDLATVTATPIQERKTIDWLIHELTDVVKKYIAYDRAIPAKETALLAEIVKTIYNSCKRVDLDFFQILENNIEKLEARYKESFTKDEANNRNLEAEKVKLSKNI